MGDSLVRTDERAGLMVKQLTLVKKAERVLNHTDGNINYFNITFQSYIVYCFQIKTVSTGAMNTVLNLARFFRLQRREISYVKLCQS